MWIIWWSHDIPEHAHHHCMVSLIRLQCELLLRLQQVCLQLLDLFRKHLGWLRRGINTVGLEWDEEEEKEEEEEEEEEDKEEEEERK